MSFKIVSVITSGLYDGKHYRSTPPPSPVPPGFLIGKVRGQSVDIASKNPGFIQAAWAYFVPNVAERVGFEPTILCLCPVPDSFAILSEPIHLHEVSKARAQHTVNNREDNCTASNE